MHVVAEMLLTEPAAVVIWALLMLLTVPAVLLLGRSDALRSGHRLGAGPDEAAYAAQFAAEVGVAAERAEVSAGRWASHRRHAERALIEAWQAWLDADARLRESRAAAAFGTPSTVPTCQEYAARERFLHRTVAAAAARGDLPPAAVADALAGRAGWDPRLHPLAQELVVHRAAAAYRRQRYDRSVEAERAARHDAELARRAGRTLRREADRVVLRNRREPGGVVRPRLPSAASRPWRFPAGI